MWKSWERPDIFMMFFFFKLPLHIFWFLPITSTEYLTEESSTEGKKIIWKVISAKTLYPFHENDLEVYIHNPDNLIISMAILVSSLPVQKSQYILEIILSAKPRLQAHISFFAARSNWRTSGLAKVVFCLSLRRVELAQLWKCQRNLYKDCKAQAKLGHDNTIPLWS